jgi:glycosyltransferase involved in cell wall biosynthesis
MGLPLVVIQPAIPHMGCSVPPNVEPVPSRDRTAGRRPAAPSPNRPRDTMNVLALAPSPIEAASTRYRLLQLVNPLRDRGIRLTVYPFIDSKSFASMYHRSEWRKTVIGLARASIRRLADISEARHADVLLVQREAAIFGPPFFEWLAVRIGHCPFILDLDDPTYISYVSPTYNHLGRWLKWPGKTRRLIRWADLVTCGNQTIADYVSSRGTPARVIPTVVDPDRFTPRPERSCDDDLPVLGWVGSHSTYPFLDALKPVLQQLAKTHPFRLKVVGSGEPGIELPGVEVENVPWTLEREVEDFQSLDIGLYPIISDDWSIGKSGFKSIQYMAVGIPFVASPVGAAAEIGERGVTHFSATSNDEWLQALGQLVSDPDLRRRMGEAGRRHVLTHYTLPHAADAFSEVLREAAGR